MVRQLCVCVSPWSTPPIPLLFVLPAQSTTFLFVISTHPWVRSTESPLSPMHILLIHFTHTPWSGHCDHVVECSHVFGQVQQLRCFAWEKTKIITHVQKSVSFFSAVR
jgi:hypothetical protein